MTAQQQKQMATLQQYCPSQGHRWIKMFGQYVKAQVFINLLLPKTKEIRKLRTLNFTVLSGHANKQQLYTFVPLTEIKIHTGK